MLIAILVCIACFVAGVFAGSVLTMSGINAQILSGHPGLAAKLAGAGWVHEFDAARRVQRAQSKAGGPSIPAQLRPLRGGQDEH